jgi:hypothetical protein
MFRSIESLVKQALDHINEFAANKRESVALSKCRLAAITYVNGGRIV